MSGNYPDTAATTISADHAAAAAAIAPAMAHHAHYQAQAAQFIVEHGAAVNGGHTQVGAVPPALDD